MIQELLRNFPGVQEVTSGAAIEVRFESNEQAKVAPANGVPGRHTTAAARDKQKTDSRSQRRDQAASA